MASIIVSLTNITESVEQQSNSAQHGKQLSNSVFTGNVACLCKYNVYVEVPKAVLCSLCNKEALQVRISRNLVRYGHISSIESPYNLASVQVYVMDKWRCDIDRKWINPGATIWS